jgi:hypothetical protein
VPRSSISSFALAGVLGVVVGAGVLGLGAPLAGCGSFGTADPEVGDGGSRAEAASTESGADGTAPVDGGSGDADPASANCMDLTSAAVQSSFTSYMDHGGLTRADPTGLSVTFPPGAADSTVSWQRALAVGPATGLTLRIDAVVDLASGTAAASWFATYAGISHGAANAVDTSSFVHLAISDQTAAAASMDMNLFPAGAGAKAVASATSKFGVVPTGAHAVSMVLGLRWSTAPGPNAHVTLGTGTGDLTSPTLQGGPAPEWTLYLGGYAARQPVLSIVYTKVCITLR